ncbi:hypothetical protein ACIRQF_00045 [Streptomyces sp. NPDC101191]|uniref:hypothetical protein n=1 Tax=Streptomyces sp. NPDC101191 TaxID=3366126 RepID=UPI0037F83FCB
MATNPVDTPIQPPYAAHLAAALEANQAEQATIIARLNKLQAEEKWLSAALTDRPSAHAAKPATARSADSAPRAVADSEDTTVLPQPRTEETAPGAAPAAMAGTANKPAPKKTTAWKITAPRDAATPVRKPSTKKAAASKTTAGAKRTKQSEPTLGQFLSTLLSREPGEPKTPFLMAERALVSRTSCGVLSALPSPFPA